MCILTGKFAGQRTIKGDCVLSKIRQSILIPCTNDVFRSSFGHFEDARQANAVFVKHSQPYSALLAFADTLEACQTICSPERVSSCFSRLPLLATSQSAKTFKKLWVAFVTKPPVQVKLVWASFANALLVLFGGVISGPFVSFFSVHWASILVSRPHDVFRFPREHHVVPNPSARERSLPGEAVMLRLRPPNAVYL